MKKCASAVALITLSLITFPILAADAGTSPRQEAEKLFTERLTLGIDLGWLLGVKLGYKHTFDNRFTLGMDVDAVTVVFDSAVTGGLTVGYRAPIGNPPYSVTFYLIAGGGLYSKGTGHILGEYGGDNLGAIQTGVGLDFTVHRNVSLALEGGPYICFGSAGYQRIEYFWRLVVQFNVWKQ